MRNKKFVLSAAIIGLMGLATAVVSTAQAGCSASTPGSNTLFVIPIATSIRLTCTGIGIAGDGRAIGNGVANTSVSADLVAGDTAVSGAYNASRVALTSCSAFDTAPPNNGPATDTTGCSGAAFHDLTVTDN